MERIAKVTKTGAGTIQDYYLIRDYTGKQPHEEPDDSIVYGSKVFEIIDKAKDEKREIAVYVIGACVLDWS